MSDKLSSSAEKVQNALNAQGFSFRVVELPASIFTAHEAAEAVGCRVEQIAKSLVFIDEDLLACDVIWAAAGTPNAIFKLRSEDLKKLKNGKVVPVK